MLVQYMRIKLKRFKESRNRGWIADIETFKKRCEEGCLPTDGVVIYTDEFIGNFLFIYSLQDAFISLECLD